MTNLRTAAQQALEALKIMQPEVQMGEGDAAITALKAALAEPFSPEAISTTQAAWKMGYEARKAEEQAEPDDPERRCGGPGCDGTCCQPVEENKDA